MYIFNCRKFHKARKIRILRNTSNFLLKNSADLYYFFGKPASFFSKMS